MAVADVLDVDLKDEEFESDEEGDRKFYFQKILFLLSKENFV